jgi:RHS repeat-associated protein
MKKTLLITLCLLCCTAFSAFATNLALNKTATASSIQGSGLEAAKAVDGNTGTRWSSASTNSEWLYVDLGGSNYIDTVKLRWENAYGLDYKIQFSGDASQWTDAAHITNGAYEYRAIPTGHAIARYVKMQGITRGTGYGYSIWEFEVIGTCVPPNNNPTDISLSSTNVVEKQPVGTAVGTLSTTDPDAGSTFTYSLVAGTGGDDNASFTIDGSSLKTVAVFNYSTKSSYSIRVKTIDNGSLPFEKQFTITVKEQNIALGKTATSSSNEGALVPGQAVDGSLASRWGSGWTDNEWIKIDLANSYAVFKVILRWENAYGKDYKIQTSQDGTNWTDASSITNAPKEDRTITFSPAVTCRYIKMQGIHRGTGWGYSLWEFEVYGNSIPNAAPTDISLSNITVFQGDAIGTVIGTFTTTDPNDGDAFTYTLVSGTGGDDNASFSINGAQLKTNVVFNSSSKPTYSIRVKTTDNGLLSYEKQFSVQVLSTADINYPLAMYAIYSTEQATICQNSTVNSGMAGSNAGIDMGDNSHVTDNVIAGTTLVLHDNSRIDKNAFAGGTITKYSNVTVGGMTRQNTSHQALTIQQKTVTPGAQNITVAGSSTLNLAPGSYNNFMALVYSKVQLSPGVYNFRSFATEPDVQIECLMEATDAIEVNVLENLDLRDRAKVFATGATQASARSIQFYSNQASVVNVHPYDNIYAMITTPNAELHIHPYTQFSGIAYGKRVYIEPNVSFDGSSSYLVDSDGDGVQDIIEGLPQFRTNVFSQRSYPAIALMKDTVGNLIDPVVDITKKIVVVYDYDVQSAPDYSRADSIPMTVPPNTIPQNEMLPMVQVKPTLVNGATPSISDTGRIFERVGGVFNITGHLMPNCSLSVPLPFPNVAGFSIGARYIVGHYDHGVLTEYCRIDSITTSAIYACVKSFSDFVVFRDLSPVTKAVAYVDDEAVYTYNAAMQPSVDFDIEISYTSAPVSGDGTRIVAGYDTGDGGQTLELNLPLSYKIRQKYVSDYQSKIGRVTYLFPDTCLTFNLRFQYWGRSSYLKLKYVKLWSTPDQVGSPSSPCSLVVDTGITTIRQGQRAFVTAVINKYKFSNDPNTIAFRKYSDIGLDYYNINTAMGNEGRQEFAGTDNSTNLDVFFNYYYLKDHLGSTRMTLSGAGDLNFNRVEATMYESYGAMDTVIVSSTVNPAREKFTGKEFDKEGTENGGTGIKLYYFGARFYDPEIGVWTSADKAGQFWNTYGYTSNPVLYIDADGNLFGIDDLLLAVIIGATAGAYGGHQIGEANHATGWSMFGYMLGGAIIGGGAGALGTAVAGYSTVAGGVTTAHGLGLGATAGIAAGSTANSVGMYALSGGKSDISTSFGVFDVNWSKGNVGYLGKGGNSTLQNIGYMMGMYGNLSDLGKKANLRLHSEFKGKGHSVLADESDKGLIDWGPIQNRIKHSTDLLTGTPGTNNFSDMSGMYPGYETNLLNVNSSAVNLVSTVTSKLPYSFLYNSCSEVAGFALNLGGVPNIPFTPTTLYLSGLLWTSGLTPAIIHNSYFFQEE